MNRAETQRRKKLIKEWAPQWMLQTVVWRSENPVSFDNLLRTYFDGAFKYEETFHPHYEALRDRYFSLPVWDSVGPKLKARYPSVMRERTKEEQDKAKSDVICARSPFFDVFKKQKDIYQDDWKGGAIMIPFGKPTYADNFDATFRSPLSKPLSRNQRRRLRRKAKRMAV